MTKDEKLKQARERRAALKQPRDWKELGWAYVLHAVEGAFAGALAMVAIANADMPLAVLAFTFSVLYLVYQASSYARRHDTVGRDIADYGAGFFVAVVVVALWFMR